MTRDQIIALAKECADQIVSNLDGRKQVLNLDFDEELVEEIMSEMVAEIERFAALVADATREECAEEWEAEVAKVRFGLENCRLLAARHRKEAWALLILGFCAESGVVGSVMR